jgi:hypothetical protein
MPAAARMTDSRFRSWLQQWIAPSTQISRDLCVVTQWIALALALIAAGAVVGFLAGLFGVGRPIRSVM